MGDGAISISGGVDSGSVSGTVGDSVSSPVQTSSSFGDLFNLPIVVKNPKKKKDNLLRTIHIGHPIKKRKSNRRRKKKESLSRLEEFTLDQIRGQVSPIIQRTFGDRRKLIPANKGSLISDFDVNEGIAYFLIEPTYTRKVKSVDPSNGDFKNDNSYVCEVQFTNWKDFTPSWDTVDLPKFREIVKSSDLKISCTCPHWWWGGLAYMWTELDVARYPCTIPAPYWEPKHMPGVPSLCKHLKEVLGRVQSQSNYVLSEIKKKVRIIKNK